MAVAARIGLLVASRLFPSAVGVILIKYKDHPLIKPIIEETGCYLKEEMGGENFSQADQALALEVQQNSIVKSDNPPVTKERLSKLSFLYVDEKKVQGQMGPAVALIINDFIYADRLYFDAFTPEEKKWVLGHEMVHIDKNHGYDKVFYEQLFGVAFIPLWLAHFRRSKFRTTIHDLLKKNLKARAGAMLTFNSLLVYYPFYLWVYTPLVKVSFLLPAERQHELEADTLAAKRYAGKDDEEGYLVGIDALITLMFLQNGATIWANKVQLLSKQAETRVEELLEQWKERAGELKDAQELKRERLRIEEQTKQWLTKEVASVPKIGELTKNLYGAQMIEAKQTARSAIGKMIGELTVETSTAVRSLSVTNSDDNTNRWLLKFGEMISTHPTTPDRIANLSALYFQLKAQELAQSTATATTTTTTTTTTSSSDKI